MEKILDIRDLRVSFRTANGTVKAVRDIDLTLNKGETLAIVGESGSGKSVTARTIMGILAPNSIVESGEVLYDGRDLLKIPEEEFHEYRGNRLSMIFQDPMSSLNPIMRIGRQMTEAMLMGGKRKRRAAAKEFKTRLAALEKAAAESGNAEAKAQFDKFRTAANTAEKKLLSYEKARTAAQEARDDLSNIVKEFPTLNKKMQRELVSEIAKALENAKHPDVVEATADYAAAAQALKTVFSQGAESQALAQASGKVLEYLDKALALPAPDYLEGDPALGAEFWAAFRKTLAQAIAYSANQAKAAGDALVPRLEQTLEIFSGQMNQSACKKELDAIAGPVEKTIDHLALRKDAPVYTFRSSIESGIRTYFEGIPNNAREEKRVAKDTLRIEKAAQKGKDLGQVVPALLVDLELTQETMVRTITELRDYFARVQVEGIDWNARAEEMVAHLKRQLTLQSVRVTKGTARNHAIKLMEEVGIAQARLRFKQYPFQFSGGMRQRIVIAIALAANPDILICDEPTTALDVTIQSQILELINRLKEERNLSVIFITHDLGVVANMADRIAVMYAGKVVEYGTADDIFYSPAHPYTWALLSSMPDLDTKEKLESIPGTPPNMIHPPKGDAFAARNRYALEIDYVEEPPRFRISDTHWAATWLLHPDSPKVDPPRSVTERIERMNARYYAEEGLIDGK